MSDDLYQKGYRQGVDDFTQKKGYAPHKLRNLGSLVFSGNKGNEEFMKGYKDGYSYCEKGALQKEARQTLNGNAQPQALSRSPDRLQRLQETRTRLTTTPEHEPEY